jgi:regulator of RNase E activity RraA
MAQLGTPGFRIVTDAPRPGAELVARFRGLASSNLADAMGRFHFLDPELRSRSALPLCGPAVTVCARPGDNLMVHKALEVARPGDVVVVSTGGDTVSAVFGELMCRTAVAARLGGIVVDGAIRDVAAIARLGFPAFARAVSPGSCDKDGPGEINLPVACGGAVVMPGDIVVGDEDGVVAVPLADAEEVLRRVEALVAYEASRVEEIDGGELFLREVDETLRRRGVIA